MKKSMKVRLFSGLVALCMLLAFLPTAAFAAGNDVAQIGDQTYATLDDAIAAASDGDTILLLDDATVSKTLDKSITIDGQGHTMTSTDVRYGFSKGRSLTFQNMTAHFDYTIEIENPEYTSDLSLFYVNGDTDFTFKNAKVYMDGAGASNRLHAIYYDGGSVGTITLDHSRLEITNFPEDAIEWSGNESNLNVLHSTYISDQNRSGITGTWNVKIDSSNVQVINSIGNGSNGSNYDIKNSVVNFSDNGSHGLSAKNLMVDSSTVTANGNGFIGVAVDGDMAIQNNSTVSLTGNAGGSLAGYAAMRLYNNNTFTVDGTSKLSIKDNQNTGLYVRQGSLTVEDGAVLEIMGNHVTNDLLDGFGGGVYVGYGANYDPTVTLPADAKIYNNHATVGGDDIYVSQGVNGPSLTFGETSASWVMDGEDCGGKEHLIDGWYDDSEGTRWEAHAGTEEGNHIEEFTDFSEETGLATVSGLTSLKAAHGKDPIEKTSFPGLEKWIVRTNSDESTTDVKDDTVAAGNTVDFKLTTNVPDDLLNYIKPEDANDPEVTGPAINTLANVPLEERGEYLLTLHDAMDDYLVEPDSFVITIDREGTDNDVTLDASQYILNQPGVIDADCDFEITMDLVALYNAGVITDADIEHATDIVVTYTAKLDGTATAGSYQNTAWVSYPGGETMRDKVTVETYKIDVFKYDQTNEEKGLEGATFEFYQKDEGGNPINVVELTSGADGHILIDGLDAGVYYLKETKAPEGYVCSEEELTITIPDQADGSNLVSVKFANSPVPHTGGMGTMLFTVGGMGILAAAGAVMIVPRTFRKKQENS